MNELNTVIPTVSATTTTTTPVSDAAALQALLADLGSPSTEAALPVLTPEQQRHSDQIMATEFAKAQSVECIPQSAQIAAARKEAGLPIVPTPAALPFPEPEPEPAPSFTRPDRVFLTGLPGVGILELLKGADALVINLHELVSTTLKNFCLLKGTPPPHVVTEFRKFGDGEYVPNLNNILQLGILRRQNAPEFGTPGCWAQVAITREGAEPSTTKQVIVVGLRTIAEFKALTEVGFAHYHVMCAPSTRQKQTNPNETTSPLAPAIEADVQKKISVARTGPRLNVVWNDPGFAAPVQRFFSAESFRKEVVGIEPVAVESDTISQTL